MFRKIILFIQSYAIYRLINKDQKRLNHCLWFYYVPNEHKFKGSSSIQMLVNKLADYIDDNNIDIPILLPDEPIKELFRSREFIDIELSYNHFLVEYDIHVKGIKDNHLTLLTLKKNFTNFIKDKGLVEQGKMLILENILLRIKG